MRSQLTSGHSSSAVTAPRAPIRVSTALTVAILAAAFLAFQKHMELAWAAVAVGALAAGLVARGVAERPMNAVFGVVYLAIPVVCLVWLRGMPEGRQWTVLLFAVAWAADIAAFAVGSALKGPKLWPRFSPNKTWSGAMGGLVSAMAVGALSAYVMEPATVPLARVLMIAAILGLLSQAGDLFESWIKRRFNVKDSSRLIPGHGGLLDRLDGVISAAPAAALLGVLLGPGEALWR